MPENLPINNRRWYDDISNMTLAMHISKHLPEEIQLVIARNLNEAIDEFRRHKRNDKYAVSLGQQRVIGLYKAGKRLRWYDPVPQLHRAFTYMSTVPEPYLSEFASRIIRVGHYIEQNHGLGTQSDHYQLVGQVEHILQEKTINIEESQGGIKLVSGGLPIIQPEHPRIDPPQQPILPVNYQQPPAR